MSSPSHMGAPLRNPHQDTCLGPAIPHRTHTCRCASGEKGRQPALYLLPLHPPSTRYWERGCWPVHGEKGHAWGKAVSWESSVRRSCRARPAHKPPALCRRNNHLVCSSHKCQVLFFVLPAELTSNLNSFLPAQENVSEEIVTGRRPLFTTYMISFKSSVKILHPLLLMKCLEKKEGRRGEGAGGGGGGGVRGKEEGEEGEGEGAHTEVAWTLLQVHRTREKGRQPRPPSSSVLPVRVPHGTQHPGQCHMC